jgi:hypothetical protein
MGDSANDTVAEPHQQFKRAPEDGILQDERA